MSIGVASSAHTRVSSGDIEMGVIDRGPSLDSGLVDERKETLPFREEVDRREVVEGCVQRCCSDAPTFAVITDISLSTIVAGGLAIWYELEDGKERAIPAVIVGIICLIAAVRVNQLRI